MKIKWTLLLIAVIIAASSFVRNKQKAVLYIIGDSTVRNGDGSGKNQQWGWGSFIADYFDISVHRSVSEKTAYVIWTDRRDKSDIFDLEDDVAIDKIKFPNIVK